jgi:hypothetical protein
MEDLQYPIGKYQYEGWNSPEARKGLIMELAILPSSFREVTDGLSEEQLDTPYRPHGWTVRQVIGHVPDSHANGYIRFKLALTEQQPTIKPYDEAKWAALPDTFQTPIEVSLAMLEVVHFRWVTLLRNLEEKDFKATYFHPESKTVNTLDYSLGMYVWHGKHHLSQIDSLRRRMRW